MTGTGETGGETGGAAGAQRDTLRYASLTSLELLLSLRIPIGSDLTSEPDLVRIALPGVTGDRQATFTIRSGEPAERGEEWFATFRDQIVERMPSAVDGFELVDRQDFVLSSFVDVTAVYYRRAVPPELGGDVSQLQAYLWYTSSQMYVVDAATARQDEGRHFPVFDAILRSIRVLPPE